MSLEVICVLGSVSVAAIKHSERVCFVSQFKSPVHHGGELEAVSRKVSKRRVKGVCAQIPSFLHCPGPKASE